MQKIEVTLSIVLYITDLRLCLGTGLPPFESVVGGKFTGTSLFFGNKAPELSYMNNINMKCIIAKADGAEVTATLYDFKNRIPLYTAYKLDCNAGKAGIKRPPFYVNKEFDAYMTSLRLKHVRSSPTRKRSRSQVNNNLQKSAIQPTSGSYQAAINAFSNTGFDKGHVAPLMHFKGYNRRSAANYMTNIAPQDPTFNRDKWMHAEKQLKSTMLNSCCNQNVEGFLVSGVIPGNQHLNNGINIPSHFWTAYCCSGKISGAIIGENSKPGNNKNGIVQHIDIITLQARLSAKGVNGNVFKNDCA